MFMVMLQGTEEKLKPVVIDKKDNNKTVNVASSEPTGWGIKVSSALLLYLCAYDNCSSHYWTPCMWWGIKWQEENQRSYKDLSENVGMLQKIVEDEAQNGVENITEMSIQQSVKSSKDSNSAETLSDQDQVCR